MRKPGTTPISANLQEVAAMLQQSRRTSFLYSGMVIHESDLCIVPRMTLSEKVSVTPEFRAKVNAWMREFFGVEGHIYTFKHPLTKQYICVMSSCSIDRHLRGVR